MREFDSRLAPRGVPPLRRPAQVFRPGPIPAAKRPAELAGPPLFVQRKGACACGGGCPSCKQENPERPHAREHDEAGGVPSSPHANEAGWAEGARRVASGTDNLEEADTTIPHAMGDVPVPMNGGGAPPASCCDQAFNAGLAGSDYGGVICCNNVKHSCVWPSNISSALTNATARAAAIACAREHEDDHHDDIDCTGAAVERPAFKPGKNARAEECSAYRIESACLTRHLPDCGSDAQCTSQLRDRINIKDGQAASNCS